MSEVSLRSISATHSACALLCLCLAVTVYLFELIAGMSWKVLGKSESRTRISTTAVSRQGWLAFGRTARACACSCAPVALQPVVRIISTTWLVLFMGRFVQYGTLYRTCSMDDA